MVCWEECLCKDISFFLFYLVVGEEVEDEGIVLGIGICL